MKTFERTLISLSAATLCGVKPASLVSFSKAIFVQGCAKVAAWNKILHAAGKCIRAVRRGENLFLLFIYDQRLLETALLQVGVSSYLAHKGYDVRGGGEGVLQQLFLRLARDRQFPHEVGVFLGYPLEDVAGYERYAGTKAKFCGSWAVYGDVAAARAQMELYKRCSVFCTALFDGGSDFVSIFEKINLYARSV